MRGCLLIVVMLGLAGCGGPTGPELVSVSGVATYQGKAVVDTDLLFLPTDNPQLGTARGKTDASGNFKLRHSSGRDGAAPGKYKVTLSKKTASTEREPPKSPLPSGVPDDREVPGAKETLPDRLWDPAKTQIMVTVPDKGGTVNVEAK